MTTPVATNEPRPTWPFYVALVTIAVGHLAVATVGVVAMFVGTALGAVFAIRFGGRWQTGSTTKEVDQ